MPGWPVWPRQCILLLYVTRGSSSGPTGAYSVWLSFLFQINSVFIFTSFPAFMHAKKGSENCMQRWIRTPEIHHNYRTSYSDVLCSLVWNLSFPGVCFSLHLKKCFAFFLPLLFFCAVFSNWCGNWEIKQTVGLGFHFLFKCSHCLRQNYDFPPHSATHKAHLPRCPLQMAIKGICFLKALSWVFV